MFYKGGGDGSDGKKWSSYNWTNPTVGYCPTFVCKRDTYLLFINDL